MRQQLILDGSWQFQLDSGRMENISTWRNIIVPGPWQAQFEDLRLSAGVGWYRRSVTIPSSWAGQQIFLRIGAADYFTEVWINEQLVGQHEGGYLPFELDGTPYIVPGAESEIVIRVVDPGKDEYDIFPEFPFAEIPHGKQSWYGPVGGIWQSVYLEARAACHIQQIHVTPRGLDGHVSVQVTLNHTPEDDWFDLRCLSPQGEVVAQTRVAINTSQIDFKIDTPQLWDINTPALYTLQVTLLTGDTPLDKQDVRFGIRTIEARDGQLWLNGQVLYLRGALDQDYYPEGIYTPPSLDFLRNQVHQAKAMGLNCLRCHIKVADPRYLQAADEEGILIWAEVPSWGQRTEKAGQRVRDTLAGMIARDWNHPSIIMWTIINENWGTDLICSAADRKWLSETVDWARQLDPTRLIVDNSPCYYNFHVKTDIDDFHFYAAMPEKMDRWQKFVSDFAGRPDFTFSPNGDGVRTGKEPLILSEFGNWGLPDIELLRKSYGGDPWWFKTGEQWNPPVVWPQNVEQRFREAGLETVFGCLSSFAQAVQWAEYRALKYEIETIRAASSISGYVITEWTDLHWECNGLVDMARNPRVFAQEMPCLNADTIIIPHWERLAYWSGETVELDFSVAHHGPETEQNAILHCSLEGGEQTKILESINLLSGMVSAKQHLTFVAPDVSEPAQFKLNYWLTLSDGRIAAHGVQPITVFARKTGKAAESPSVWAADPALRDWLVQQEYTLDREHGLWITDQWDGEVRCYVENGGRTLLCATQPQTISSTVRVEARRDTPWSGDWVSSFAWVRPGATCIPGEPLIDFSWRGLFPEYIITGIAPEQMSAGLFVGWIHLPVALIGHVALGDGRLTITSFPVLKNETAFDQSPVRSVLLHDLIRTAVPKSVYSS